MSHRKKDPIYHELERISLKELQYFRKRTQDVNGYFRGHFNYFSDQRKQVFNELTDALRSNCFSFPFQNYQRVASFKYSLNPLSAKGSVLNPIGGRFNIGKINPNIPKFAALYIAQDKATALREVYQIEQHHKDNLGLNSEELCLINENSLSIVVIDGTLEQTLDLRDKNTLKDFFKIIKKIKLPKDLAKKAMEIHLDPHPEIKTLNQLYSTLFDKNYKRTGLLFDFPSNSQILGHIAFEAGIQGILYPSKFTKLNCLAIYPSNFEESDSYISIKEKDIPEGMPKENYTMNKDNFNNFI